jgi:hypothetical protein
MGWLERHWPLLKKIWEFVRGTPHLRFALALLAGGVALALGAGTIERVMAAVSVT